MEKILAEFAHLNKIPRPSGHEQAVAAYLQKRGEELGVDAHTDENLNVIYEVAATPGYENSPRVILQAHIDMVCVGGEDYNPLTDPIITKTEGNILTAVGTSLGADDGIGVAMILALLGSEAPHGPLRVILTADEEQGMTGAAALDNKYLIGDYLINLDWEDFESLCVGCAGFLTMEYSLKAAKIPIEATGLKFTVSGLKGGHSGTEIWENRANAIKVLADFCEKLAGEGIDYRLSDFTGGRAVNVIPYTAAVTLSLNPEQESEAREVWEKYQTQIKSAYPQEKNIQFALDSVTVTQGYSPDATRGVVGFLATCPQGVKEYSPLNPEAVSLSDNVAIINCDDEITLTVSIRSDVDAKMKTLAAEIAAAGEKFGFTSADLGMSPAWTPRNGSPLQDLAIKVYKDIAGTEPKLESVHAGLECSYFAQRNRDLDMVSLGPTILWCHSVDEIVHLDTIAPARKWLEGILAGLK